MKIQITDEMKAKARKLAEEFEKLNIEGKENHIFKTEDNLEKKRIGFIGELAFEEYLKKENLNYEKDDCLFRSDKFDFKIKNKTIDVKTSLWLNYKTFGYLLTNKAQVDSNKTDLFVYVVIHDSFAEIWGFVETQRLLTLFLNTKLPSPAYELHKEDMNSIRGLKCL